MAPDRPADGGRPLLSRGAYPLCGQCGKITASDGDDTLIRQCSRHCHSLDDAFLMFNTDIVFATGIPAPSTPVIGQSLPWALT